MTLGTGQFWTSKRKLFCEGPGQEKIPEVLRGVAGVASQALPRLDLCGRLAAAFEEREPFLIDVVFQCRAYACGERGEMFSVARTH